MRETLGGVGGSLGSSVGIRSTGATTKGRFRGAITIGTSSKGAGGGEALDEVKALGALKAGGLMLKKATDDGVLEGGLNEFTVSNSLNCVRDEGAANETCEGGELNAGGCALKKATGEGVEEGVFSESTSLTVSN